MTTAERRRSRPWSIDESEFYELENRKDELEFLLRYAVLAPSGHNTQPWTFAVVPEGIEVFADYTRRLPLVDPGDRELLMSIGAAIMNLRVAAAHFGYESTVLHHDFAPGTPALALVSLRETCAPDRSLGRLFPAIQRRRTNRQPFDGEAIGTEALTALCDVADEHSQTIQFLLPHDRERILQLVMEGDRLQMEDPAVRAEMAEWIRPASRGTADGMRPDALGMPNILSGAVASILRHADLGNRQARRDAKLIGTTPLLLVITAEDDRVSLLEAGQVLERLLLTVTLAGLQYSFMNQPVQVATLRDVLAPIVRSSHPPQLLLRIGYAPPVGQTTPRRDVVDVIQVR